MSSIIDVNKNWVFKDEKNGFSYNVPIEKFGSEYGAILFSVKFAELEQINFKLFPKFEKYGYIPGHYFSKDSKVNDVSFKILVDGEYLAAQPTARQTWTFATKEAFSQTKSTV